MEGQERNRIEDDRRWRLEVASHFFNVVAIREFQMISRNWKCDKRSTLFVYLASSTIKR